MTANGSDPSLKWDAEGRMKAVTPSGGTATNYVYNALGQRVEKYTGSAYTEIAYDAFGSQVGLHNRTTWVAHYIPFAGRPFATYQSGKTYFLHPNHLGSTTSVTDETGATTQKTIYYPWGQAWATAGTVKDNRFASMDPRDSESGNDPTLFRMYQPRLYRWLTPDPQAGNIMDPQSLNRYGYVMNNPTNLTDPLGLHHEGEEDSSWSPIGATGGGCAYIWMTQGFTEQTNSWCTPSAVNKSPAGYFWGSDTSLGGILGGGGSGVVGWNPNSPPINLPAPPITLGGLLGIPTPNPGCDWSCAGPAPNYFGPGALLLPAGAAAQGAIVYGVPALIVGYWFYKNPETVEKLTSLMNVVAKDIGRLMTDPGRDPRNHWREKIKGLIKQMREKANRLPRRQREFWERMIDAAERAVPQD